MSGSHLFVHRSLCVSYDECYCTLSLYRDTVGTSHYCWSLGNQVDKKSARKIKKKMDSGKK